MAWHVRRLARRAPLCLALGLATTVVVAWGLALWLPHRHLSRRFNAIRPAEDDRFGMIWVREFLRPGMVRREWWYDPRSGMADSTRLGDLQKEAKGTLKPNARESYRWGRLRRVVTDRDRPVAGIEDARGWPVLALWCELAPPDASGRVGIHVEGGVAADWSGGTATLGEFRALPMRPIWTGLAVDTAVWAGTWLVLLEGGWLARRLVRRGRGRCPECGYDLRGQLAAGCPECGWRRMASSAPAGTAEHVPERGPGVS